MMVEFCSDKLEQNSEKLQLLPAYYKSNQGHDYD